MAEQPKNQAQGPERIDELCEKYPSLNRSIIIKNDVMREGLALTPELQEAGSWSYPHFLVWNPDHAWNPLIVEPGEGELTAIPWKLDLLDDTPINIRLIHDSPYAVYKHEDGAFWLYRGGKELGEITFERASDWIYKNTEDGTMMGSVFLAWTRRAVLGCSIRFCEYTREGLSCKYCSLDADAKRFEELGFKYDMFVQPHNAYETYMAAAESTGFPLKQVAFTGGSLKNREGEAERWIGLFEAIQKGKEELKADTEFYCCCTAPPDIDTVEKLRASGLNHIAPNLEQWDPKMWPIVMPGKHKYIGRDNWLASLQNCVKVYGKGKVQTVLVVGPEMVQPFGFKTFEEGTKSWKECFDWCLSNGVIPTTSPWKNSPDDPWGEKEVPPVEYWLEIDQMRYEMMKEYKAYEWMDHNYYKAIAWHTNGDHSRLDVGCDCSFCNEPNLYNNKTHPIDKETPSGLSAVDRIKT